MDFVVIATPNHTHHPIAKAALNAGFHVMSDKPATFDLDEAKELAELVEETGLVFGLTHNYTGYPMVKEARHLVRTGAFGNIRRVVVEYIQGWLSERLEGEGNKQAEWRTDPARSGAAGCMGDIGTHGENLVEYVTGLARSSRCARISRPSCRAGSSRTTATSCYASTTAPRASCSPARSPWARRTA